MKRCRLFFLVLSTAMLAACLLCFAVARAQAPRGSRVEVIFALPEPQAEAAVEEVLAASEGQLAAAAQRWAEGRWTVTGADPFTAQDLEAALGRTGLAAEQFLVLDYSWADEAVRHAPQLWQITGAFCLLCLLGALITGLARREYRRGEAAMQTQYLSQYLSQRGEGLITLLILLVPVLLLAAVLIRWLWRMEVILPTGFLPDGSIFDGAHYRQWVQTTFPAGRLSAYGTALGKTLFVLYGTALAISVAEILVTISLLWQQRGE